jgi:hypothetical protein
MNTNQGGAMVPELAVDQLRAAVEEVAGAALAEHGVQSPPVDALGLAGRLGMSVAWDYRQQARARFVRQAGRGLRAPRGLILLRPEPREERRQWAVAHEIGEHLAHEVYAALAIDPRETPPQAREEVANLLARGLLLPLEWFAAAGEECGWELPRLKRTFSTASHELIARRMLDCAPPVIVTQFDQNVLRWRRSNVPGRPPPLSSAETECRQQAHRTARPSRATTGGLAIAAWPIHEPSFQREIMRTEVQDAMGEVD